MKKAIISCALACIMVLSVACGGSSFDASAYVKSCLDLLTKCEYEEYIKLTERSAEEAIADYEASVDNIMTQFSDLGISEELVANYRTLFKELYKVTKYNVLEAVETEDGNYTVDVEIEQVTGVFNGVAEELNTAAAAYGEELAESNTEIDEAAINEWVYSKLYEILNGNLAEITYAEKQVITVRVVLDGEKYTIPDEDYLAMDKALIDLGDMSY